MKQLIEVSGPHEIEQAPEMAILGVLEHALFVAGTTLGVEHPPVGRVSEWYEGRLPPRQVLLAQLIVDRCTELAELVAWYRRSCPPASTSHPILAEDRAELELF